MNPRRERQFAHSTPERDRRSAEVSEGGFFTPRAEVRENFETVHMAGGPDHRDAIRVLGKKAGRWEFPEGWENDPRNKPAQELREKRAHTVRTIQSICTYLTGAGLMNLFQVEGARFANSAFAPFAPYAAFFLMGVALSRFESTIHTKGPIGFLGTMFSGFCRSCWGAYNAGRWAFDPNRGTNARW